MVDLGVGRESSKRCVSRGDQQVEEEKVVEYPSVKHSAKKLDLQIREADADGSKPRFRSLSAGRIRSKPSDIVQDVYDRLGVKRGDLLAEDTASNASSGSFQHDKSTRSLRSNGLSEDKFSMRYRASAIVRDRGRQRQPPPQNGGSSANDRESSESPRRPRSLSRGRIRDRWPPSPSPPAGEQNLKEPKKESDDQQLPLVSSECEEEILRVTPPSVKDRLQMYRGSTSDKSTRSTKRSVDPQYAAHFAVRDHPPKIDIYQDEKRRQRQEHMENGQDLLEEKKEDTISPPPSDCVTGKQKLKSSSCHEVHSPVAASRISPEKSGGSGLANAYMAAIQAASPKTQSLPLISASNTADDQETASDTVSVSVSSVSAEEMPPTLARPGSRDHTKKPSWQERNRVSAYSSASGASTPQTSNQNLSPRNHAAINEATLERLVEERVRARLGDLEARIETQLRRSRDETLALRVGALEQQIIRLTTALEHVQGVLKRNDFKKG